MKLLFLWPYLCFLLLLNSYKCTGLIWEDEDSIGIDAEVKKQPRSPRQFNFFNNYNLGYNFLGYEEVEVDSIDNTNTDNTGNTDNTDIAEISGLTDYTDPESSFTYFGNNYGPGPSRNKPGVCKTRNGEMGVCASLSDCYPVLYTMNSYRGERNITNFPLAEDLIRNSGPCSNNPQDLMNNIICCSTLYNARYSEQRPSRPPVRAPISPIPPNCGKAKITQSKEAPRGTYPWIAALMLRGRQFCGGSLIDDYHVLTAAHCVAHFGPNEVNNLQIYLGAHDLYSVKDRDEGRVSVGAARVIFHRGFSHQTLLNDVAVIRLSRRVDYQRLRNIDAICLTSGNPPYDRGYPQAVLAGWGKLYDKGPQPSRLQHAKMLVFPQDECRRRYGRIPPAGYLPDHNVCAAGERGRDACQGDSGGPLMRYLQVSTHPKPLYRVEQIGIVSWGVNCGAFPGVYVRPDHFSGWINKNRFG